MSTRMNELGNPFTRCLLNDLRLPLRADRAGTPVYLPRYSSRDEHTLLTPCFQRFLRAASNVANLSQIAQRAGSVRPHGVVFCIISGKGMGNAGSVLLCGTVLRGSACTSFARRRRAASFALVAARPCAAFGFLSPAPPFRFRRFVRAGHASPLSHAAPSGSLTQSASYPRAARPGRCLIPPKTQKEGRDP